MQEGCSKSASMLRSSRLFRRFPVLLISKDFRPTSLVGGIYKIEVLANRLKVIMDKIISRCKVLLLRVGRF
jgi:hypothetical protein